MGDIAFYLADNRNWTESGMGAGIHKIVDCEFDDSIKAIPLCDMYLLSPYSVPGQF